MTRLEPRGMHDMTGWHKITCEQADIVIDRHRDMPHDVFYVASSCTDPEGTYGPPVIFTEWWYDGHPLIREYRGEATSTCRHYGATDDYAARRIDDEDGEPLLPDSIGQLMDRS